MERCANDMISALMLLLLLLRFNVLLGTSGGADVMITNFYSCDALGYSQDYFPKKTTAYFNISIRSLAHDPKNISIYLTVQDELSVPIGSDQLYTIIAPDISTYYIMNIFIPKWAYVGIATGYVSVLIEGIAVDSRSTSFYIGPEDLTPPVMHLLSPENLTYEIESIPLVFTINERICWIGYSLNNLENVTIAGNTTLSGLANGSYSAIVYANDTSGNVGSSEKVYFTILVVHDVAVVNLECSSTEVYLGEIVNITVSVQNEGTVSDSFNVIVYTDTIAVETFTVANLFPGNQTTLACTWNTTGFAKGNYTISAYAQPVPNETEITNNILIDGIVNVKPRPNIAVTNIEPSKTSIAKGYSMSINVTVKNQGEDTETFNVTTYANTTTIQKRTLTLISGNCTTVAFLWNTSGFAKGNYTINAYAEPVLGEIDIGDNILIDDLITVTISGDVNGDFKCDGKDIAIIVKAFDTTLGNRLWNPNADINGDFRVDGKELAIVAKNFGQKDP